VLREGGLIAVPIGGKIRLGVPVAAYCCGIFYLSALERVPDAWAIFPDKIAHVILYAGLGFLVALYLKRNHKVRTILIWALAAAFCFAYGITDEFHQSFVNGRCAEIGDVIADFAGGLLGSILCTELITRHFFPVTNRNT